MPFTASLVFVLLTALVFVHFTTFGARTFVIRPLDNGADWGMASFASGILVTQLTWVFHRMSLYGAIAGVVLLVCSMTLYEWARRSVRGRGLSVGLSERVPDAVFEGGPYAYIRHPFYVSYMLAFAAVALAIPSIWTFTVFAANVLLYICMAVSDERAMSKSTLASAYATYKQRVGQFLPRLPRLTGSTL